MSLAKVLQRRCPWFAAFVYFLLPSRRLAIAVAESLSADLQRLDRTTQIGYAVERDKETSTAHLLWMCDQISAARADFSTGKMNRWIGYVQGVMTQRAMTTVAAERQRYRDVKAAQPTLFAALRARYGTAGNGAAGRAGY